MKCTVTELRKTSKRRSSLEAWDGAEHMLLPVVLFGRRGMLVAISRGNSERLSTANLDFIFLKTMSGLCSGVPDLEPLISFLRGKVVQNGDENHGNFGTRTRKSCHIWSRTLDRRESRLSKVRR